VPEGILPMDMPVEVRDIVARAVAFESMGNNARAQAGYLDAMQRLGQREPVFRGTLYINLAHVFPIRQ
jgi:hypothetical protein